MSNRSKILITLAISVLIAAALAGSAEALLQQRYRQSGVAGSMSLALYQHRRLGLALVRNLDYFGWAHINEHGFRGGPVTVEKSAGVFRIMAVGGSTTFDALVAGDENAWPARLQRRLREVAPQQHVEVINAGVPSHRVIDNQIRLQTELYRFAPNLIILYQTHNDLQSVLWRATAALPEDRDRPEETPATAPWTRWLASHSLFYNRIRSGWASLFGANSKEGATIAGRTRALHDAVERGAQSFGQDLASFLAVARTMGICVVLPEVAHPSAVGALHEADPAIVRRWERTYEGIPPDTVLHGYARYREVTDSVAHLMGAVVVPTDAFGLNDPDAYAPADAVHFSAAGSARMGIRLADELATRRVWDLAAWCPARLGR